MYHRPQFELLLKRFSEPRRFIQVLVGPRQVGKTTLARQLIDACAQPAVYASADGPLLESQAWVETQWELARRRAHSAGTGDGILVLDEVQKIQGWSELVKRLWDEDTASGRGLKVLLLGSSSLHIRRGLTESMAGRFELIRMGHWSFSEMREAFGWDLDNYLFFGGFPGAAPLIDDRDRWADYILDSLVETTISRDILLMSRVDKPVLLRRLFRLGCDYSGQILSYQKMLGQLHDAGNTTTLAHYLYLLECAGMVAGLQKHSGQRVRQRGSSPKLQVLNTALMTAPTAYSLSDAIDDRTFWGRLIESAVGAHLVNGAASSRIEVFYRRERNREVDFVLRRGKSVTAIEVKSGSSKGILPGMLLFERAFNPQKSLLVGEGGISLEEFLSSPVESWV